MPRPRLAKPSEGPLPPSRKLRLPVLNVDWTADPAEVIEKRLPITENKEANVVGWPVRDLRMVNQSLGIYENIPMLCAATGCIWANFCPSKKYGYPFEGYRCPIELLDIFRLFAGYVVDLGIDPNRFTDLKLVEDLIRIDIHLKRIDQALQSEGTIVNKTTLVDQKSGRAFGERAAHSAVATQNELRKRRSETYAKLLADKRSRIEQETKDQGSQKALHVLIQQLKRERHDTNIIDVTPPLPSRPSLLASFNDDDDEEEDDE